MQQFTQILMQKWPFQVKFIKTHEVLKLQLQYSYLFPQLLVQSLHPHEKFSYSEASIVL